MAHIDVRNVAIRGISASIPRNKEQIVKIYEKWGGGRILYRDNRGGT